MHLYIEPFTLKNTEYLHIKPFECYFNSISTGPYPIYLLKFYWHTIRYDNYANYMSIGPGEHSKKKCLLKWFI